MVVAHVEYTTYLLSNDFFVIDAFAQIEILFPVAVPPSIKSAKSADRYKNCNQRSVLLDLA
jgi:hypothetical protein